MLSSDLLSIIWNPHITPESRYYIAHVWDRETQRGCVTFLKSQSWSVTRSSLESRSIRLWVHYLSAATAKSLQSYPTLCDPIDGSPPGSPIPGILQARTLEWVAIYTPQIQLLPFAPTGHQIKRKNMSSFREAHVRNNWLTHRHSIQPFRSSAFNEMGMAGDHGKNYSLS